MNNLITQEAKDRIDKFCNNYGISYYSINQDGSIDVVGDVEIWDLPYKLLPIRFGKVSGDFSCRENEISSLVGCPNEVGGDFTWVYTKITSLVGCPNIVGGRFFCFDNILTSLEGSPKIISEDFDCSNNELTTLKGCPIEIGGGFYCTENELTTLEGCPVKIGGDVQCVGNNLPSLIHSLMEILNVEELRVFLKYINDYEVWSPEFNEANLTDLHDDIKDGLK